MHVLLFDIDGTLILSGGAGKSALEEALELEFDIGAIIPGVSYSGRTDLAIARDLLELHGVEPTNANLDRLLKSYLRVLPDSLVRHQGQVLPGVRDLLNKIKQTSNCILGLLTGNIHEGARHKLSHFDLWHYFGIGNFADGFTDRDDIARSARAQMNLKVGREIPDNHIWIIGDTPFDVKCAKAIGARSIAVATGWHSPQELARAGADQLFSDLSNTAMIMRLWS